MKKHQRSMLSLQLHGKQLLALLLSAILLFASLPVAAIAEDGLPQEDGTPQIYDNTAEGANAAEADEGEVMEIESLREASVKHFYMGDGTYRAVSYGTEVHRKDAEGAWQEIDNTLTLQNGYHTTPDGRIKLASGCTANGYLLQLAENGYGIHMTMLPPSEPSGDMSMDMNANATLHTGSVTIQNAQREAVLESDSAEVQYQKLSKTLNHSKLTYANLSAGLDVSYELSGNKITEKIVVKGARDSYEFAFRLRLTGLTAALDENDTITFTDAITGEAVYTMPAPFMTDLASGTTHAAAYELLAVDEESYLLIVSVDAELANEILTADDTAALIGSENGGIELCAVISDTEIVEDAFAYAYISPEEPGTEHDMYDVHMTGGNKGYVLFGMPNIPGDVHVRSALLSMTHSSADTCVLSLYKCNYAWYNTTWTYYAAQSRGDWGMSTANSVEFVVSTNGFATADISSYVLDWISGAPNHGFGIVPEDSELESPFYMFPDESVLEIDYQYAAINDGIYYFQNADYKTFLDVDTSDDNITYIPSLLSWEFGEIIPWEIIRLENGYYRIQEANKGKVLTAAGNAETSGVGVRSYSNGGIIAEYQQWRIIPVGDKYMIVSRASYEAEYKLCVAAEENASQAVTIGMSSAYGTPAANELWYITPNVVAVEVHYDTAYVERFGEGMSEEAKIASVRTKLNNYMERLRTEYISRYSINVIYTIQQAATPCFACINCTTALASGNNTYQCMCLGSNVDPCITGSFLHHTNIDTIMLHFYNSNPKHAEDKIIRIFFIGHNICNIDEDEHQGFGSNENPAPLGKAYCDIQTNVNWGIITIHNFEDQSGSELKTLAHELGHMYRVEDHYGNGKKTTEQMNQDSPSANYSSYCIYGEHKDNNNVIANLTTCQGCTQTILANVKRYCEEP